MLQVTQKPVTASTFQINPIFKRHPSTGRLDCVHSCDHQILTVAFGRNTFKTHTKAIFLILVPKRGNDIM